MMFFSLRMMGSFQVWCFLFKYDVSIEVKEVYVCLRISVEWKGCFTAGLSVSCNWIIKNFKTLYLYKWLIMKNRFNGNWIKRRCKINIRAPSNSNPNNLSTKYKGSLDPSPVTFLIIFWWRHVFYSCVFYANKWALNIC